ncbi:Hypothetical protein AA314_06755 [Archangium gephyra]|uniref:Uncharacterized protein n=1 Tax=Archangium gephyra TaxID=48 RepID=A0AAC8QCV3_9BACT|nr:Hypothetical protein AA314_06755 [Archangium gephyra]
MPVLLLSPRFRDDSIALATEASLLSWRVHRAEPLLALGPVCV